MYNFKRIPFHNLYNFRDLGGYLNKDGYFFEFNKIYRSDVPDKLNLSEWNFIIDRGIRTIIDLRSESECKYMSYTPPKEIKVFNLPLQEIDLDLKDIIASSNMAFSKSLQESYEEMILKNIHKVANIINVIADSLSVGGVLFHCTAGKDRTGVLACLIYMICGIEPQDIIADYQLSATYNEYKKDSAIEIPKELLHLTASSPETMKNLIRITEERQIIRKLYENGLDRNKIIFLKSTVMKKLCPDDRSFL